MLPEGVHVAQSAIGNTVTTPLPLSKHCRVSQSSKVGSSARAATMPVSTRHTPVRHKFPMAFQDHTGSSCLRKVDLAVHWEVTAAPQQRSSMLDAPMYDVKLPLGASFDPHLASLASNLRLEGCCLSLQSVHLQGRRSGQAPAQARLVKAAQRTLYSLNAHCWRTAGSVRLFVGHHAAVGAMKHPTRARHAAAHYLLLSGHNP